MSGVIGSTNWRSDGVIANGTIGSVLRLVEDDGKGLSGFPETGTGYLHRDASGNLTFQDVTAAASASTAYQSANPAHGKVTLQPQAAVFADYTLTLPSAVGSANQILQTNSSGQLSFVTPSISTLESIGNVVGAENSPQYNALVSVGGGSGMWTDVKLMSDMLGDLDKNAAPIYDGALFQYNTTTGKFENTNELRLRSGANANGKVTIQTSQTAFTNYSLTLPAADGTSGQALTTNASGVLSFSGIGVANFSFDAHLLPTTNSTFDIGSASKKIRHIFISNTSLKFGSASNSEVYLQLKSGTTGNWAMTLPTAAGTAGQNLITDGAGVTSWSATKVQISTPASATATGTVGEVRADADYVYVCVATDTWKRAAIATW